MTLSSVQIVELAVVGEPPLAACLFDERTDGPTGELGETAGEIVGRQRLLHRSRGN
jgi:hypothetical protein